MRIKIDMRSFTGVILLIIMGQGTIINGYAQIYQSKDNTITFFSEAPLEDITAITEKAVAIVNIQTGEIAARVPIKSFEFKKALMQEHFNEQYMESEKFPYAIFQGQFLDVERLRNLESGNYRIKGKMSIHGVTKSFEKTVSVKLENDSLYSKTKFLVKLADYEIKIPKILVQNIAEIIEVEVTLNLKKTTGNE